MDMNPAPARTRLGKIRWTEDEYAEVQSRAARYGANVSAYVRQAALGRRMLPVADAQLIGELRRIGALLKHQYPKVETWTAQEKARYWKTRETLMALAIQIEKRVKTGR